MRSFAIKYHIHPKKDGGVAMTKKTVRMMSGRRFTVVLRAEDTGG